MNEAFGVNAPVAHAAHALVTARILGTRMPPTWQSVLLRMWLLSVLVVFFALQVIGSRTFAAILRATAGR